MPTGFAVSGAVPEALAAWCAAQGWRNVRSAALVGGAVNTVVRLSDDLGRTLVAKCTPAPPAGLYAAEADGLRELARTATVDVPAVVAVSEEFLVLEDLAASGVAEVDWARLGRSVAALHGHTADRFGADRSNFLGLLPQDNTWTADGHEFFARRRLLRYVDEPLVAAAFTAEDRRRLDRVAARLRELVPVQPPALLHGDLWSGNVAGPAAVLDPAVHFGWPEAELSMTWCAGGADPRFFEAYLEVHPLEPGWQERMPLLHLREHLSVLAHFGSSAALDRIREVLRRFAG